MAANDVKLLGLTTKLAEVGKTLTWLQKRGQVAGGAGQPTYKYATEADLVMAIRTELFNRNIFLYPLYLSHKRDTITKQTDKGEKVSHITDVVMQWKWVDGDTGEEQICSMPGSGADPGDKGMYKGITGSEKYFLLKSFLIPTFDDAEKMSPTDKKALQERIAVEKVAEMKAHREAKGAQSEEEAKAAFLKGQVLFITLPERFDGEYAAIFGKPIVDEKLVLFFSDVAAARFKGPEGVYYKLEAQYIRDCKALAEKLGYTVDTHEMEHHE